MNKAWDDNTIVEYVFKFIYDGKVIEAKYEVYNAIAFDIDYHPEPKLIGSNKRVYHIHFYRNGVCDKLDRLLSDDEYENIKNISKECQKDDKR